MAARQTLDTTTVFDPSTPLVRTSRRSTSTSSRRATRRPSRSSGSRTGSPIRSCRPSASPSRSGGRCCCRVILAAARPGSRTPSPTTWGCHGAGLREVHDPRRGPAHHVRRGGPALHGPAPVEERGGRSIAAHEYVRYGPFGRAILRARFERRSGLLIHEIDKADLDFPKTCSTNSTGWSCGSRDRRGRHGAGRSHPATGDRGDEQRREAAPRGVPAALRLPPRAETRSGRHEGDPEAAPGLDQKLATAALKCSTSSPTSTSPASPVSRNSSTGCASCSSPGTVPTMPPGCTGSARCSRTPTTRRPRWPNS